MVQNVDNFHYLSFTAETFQKREALDVVKNRFLELKA